MTTDDDRRAMRNARRRERYAERKAERGREAERGHAVSRDGSVGSRLRGLATEQTDVRTLGLLVEAARIADRLDDMDQIIAGKGVLNLLRFRLVDDEGRVAEVKFDGVLAEARQQANVLKGLLAQIGVPKLEAVAERRSGIDQLRARRAARAAERAAEAAGSS